MNKIKCLNQNHNFYIVSYCLNKQCQLERLCCIQCEEEQHTNHSNQLFDFHLMNCFLELFDNQYDYESQNKESIQILEQIKTSIDIVNEKQSENNYLTTLRDREFLQYQKCECYENFIIAIEVCAFPKLFSSLYFENETIEITENLYKCFKALIDCSCSVKNSNENQYLKFQKQPIEIEGFYNKMHISKNGAMIMSEQNERQNGTIIEFLFSNTKLNNQHYQSNLFLKQIISESLQLSFSLQFTKLSLNNTYIAIGKNTITEIYNINQNKIYWKFKCKETFFKNFIFSHDCQFAIITENKKLIIWSLPLKRIIRKFQTGHTILKVLISKDNKLVACHTNPSIIYIWDLQQGREVAVEFPNSQDDDGFCSSDDFTMFMLYRKDVILIWELANSNSNMNYQLELIETHCIYISEADNPISNLAFPNTILKIKLTSDNKYICALVSKFCQIRIIEIASEETISQLSSCIGPGETVYWSFSDDMNIFIARREMVTQIRKREQNELQQK